MPYAVSTKAGENPVTRKKGKPVENPYKIPTKPVY